MANRMPIIDCDEVFNYWEPLHFLHYGTGMQTWEYAPQYALRTYAYLAPMVGFSHLFEFLQGWKTFVGPLLLLLGDSTSSTIPTKIWIFGALRSTLAILTATSEVQFVHALWTCTKSKPIALWTLLLLATSAGMAHASNAYLPSSTIMVLFLKSCTCWLQERYVHTMAYGVVATLAVGWPFGAILFVPMGLHILVDTYHAMPGKTTLSTMISSTFLWLVGIQGIVMTEDYKQYGTWVSPIYNILNYNVLNGGGDELYGVEPLSYYIKNLCLNFNYVALLAICFPAFSSLLVMEDTTSTTSTTTTKQQQARLQKRNEVTLRILLSPLFLWFVVVLPRPHKEERFLYPIYPLLCLGAAVTVDKVWNVLASTTNTTSRRTKTDGTTSSPSQQYQRTKLIGGTLLLLPSCLLSISRTMALSKYYTAPLLVYAQLPFQQAEQEETKEGRNQLVCTCGEWYRFPSSYYLPQGYELGFLPSTFHGQLPQPFTKYGSKKESLAIQTGTFNDVNMEETDRYVSSISECSYVVELVHDDYYNKDDETKDDDTTIPECLEYMNVMNKKNPKHKQWTSIASFPYLDASQTRTLHRMFYIPGWHEYGIQDGSIKYNSYILYENPNL